ARARHEIAAEQGIVGLVAIGVDIGDVVGDDVELMRERDLPRQADEKRILHRIFSLGGTRRPLWSGNFVRRAGGSPKPRLATLAPDHLQKPCQQIKLLYNNILWNAAGAGQRAESAVYRAPLGK